MKQPLLIFLVLTLSIADLFSQKVKEVDVSFYSKGKSNNSVNYFSVRKDTAYLLNIKNNKLFIDSLHFKKRLKILVIHNKNKILFNLDPNAYYLNITEEKRCFIFSKSKYIINQGFDFEEIVKKSKKKFYLSKSSKQL